MELNPYANEAILEAVREWHEAAAQVAYLLRQQGHSDEADRFLEIAAQDLAERDLVECRSCLRIADSRGSDDELCRECYERELSATEKERELEHRARIRDGIKNGKE